MLKKLLSPFIVLLFCCCEKDDIVNQVQSEKTVVFEKPNINSKMTPLSSTTLHFDYGITAMNSGCTIDLLDYNFQFYTYTGVYGPIPQPQEEGYMVRGYGKPYHNLHSNSLIMHASNTKVNAPNGGYASSPRESAISVEYTFRPNVTYEIAIKTFFTDTYHSVENIRSNGFPTLEARMESSPIINGPDPCSENSRMSGYAPRYDYIYARSISLDSYAEIARIFTYKFSPIEQKNALIITLKPTTLRSNDPQLIPRNSFKMELPLITITEKPFDPSLNTPPPSTYTPGRR